MSKSPETRLSDEELLARARADAGSQASRQAASELLGRYYDQVYQWCYRYARDHDGALDLAQDVLLRAYRKLDTFEGRAKFSSWLFVVTRSTCLNAVQRVEPRADPEFEMETLGDSKPGPDAAIERAQETERMMRIINDVLDPQEQEAFILRYFDYMPPEEITRILRLTSRSGARGLLQRARRKLTAAMERRQQELDHDDV